MSDKFRSRFESVTFDNEEDRNAYDNEHLRKTTNEIMDRHKQTFQKLREHEIKEQAALKMTLPTDSAERKNYPIMSGCLNYFPAAIAGIANISKKGNDKHNPGQPLHHARGKSMDHGDCIIRHLIDVENLVAAYNRKEPGATKELILLEASQMAWRALAYSQVLHEFFGAPLAPGAKTTEGSE